jgi:hypothetical protein
MPGSVITGSQSTVLIAIVQPLQAIVVGAPRLVSKLDPTVVAALAVAGISAAAASAATGRVRTGVENMAGILSDAPPAFVLRADGLRSSGRRIDVRVTIRSRGCWRLRAMHASTSTFRGDPDELLARYGAMLARHGLPDPVIEDHPVHAAFAR